MTSNNPPTPPDISIDDLPDLVAAIEINAINGNSNTFAVAKLETLMNQARINELKLLNGLVTARQFHVPSRHKIYQYISDRLATLEGKP